MAADLAVGFLVVVLVVLAVVLAALVVLAGLAAGLAFDALAAGLADLAVVFVDFLAPRVTPLALASLDAAALRREAVFFLIKPFLAALSYSVWSLERLSADGLLRKSLRAVLIDFLISLLCSVRFTAWRAAFLADLIIGMYFPIG